MAIGPVEYVIVGFPGNKFKGEIVPELAALVASGTITVIDLAFVKKDADGTITAFELDDLPMDEANPFSDFEARIGGLLNEEDLELAGEALEEQLGRGAGVGEHVGDPACRGRPQRRRGSRRPPARPARGGPGGPRVGRSERVGGGQCAEGWE